MNSRFKDKVVLVTGSSTGIGRATAIDFAKEGAAVVINCDKSVREARELVKNITKERRAAIFIQCDVSKEREVKRMIQRTVNKFGKIDILVNNAGITKQSDFLTLPLKDFQKTLNTDLLGTFLCMQYAAKEMIKRHEGKIVNVASIRGLGNCARKDMIDYSAAKAGVINMTKSIAKELAPFGINVNAVAPGITRTELVKGLSKQAREKAINGTLLGRMAEPEEISKSILFLASDEADYIVGEILVVDGGYNMTKL